MIALPNEDRSLLGRHHALARRIRALRRSGELRAAEGQVVAEGVHLAREALRSGSSIEHAIYTPRLQATSDGVTLLRELRDAGAACQLTSEPVLISLQDARSPQPILCLVRTGTRSAEEESARIAKAIDRGTSILLLAGIQDPGNLGSIVRSAESAGVDLVAVGRDAVDATHPRALRASAGSLFRLRPVVTELPPLIERLRAGGYRLLGADPRGAESYHRVELRGRIAWILGSESAGLPEAILRRVDLRVRIPMQSGVESLSVVAAAAILLFEMRRQRAAD